MGMHGMGRGGGMSEYLEEQKKRGHKTDAGKIPGRLRCKRASASAFRCARHADWAMWILAILRPTIPLKRCQSVAAAACYGLRCGAGEGEARVLAGLS